MHLLRGLGSLGLLLRLLRHFRALRCNFYRKHRQFFTEAMPYQSQRGNDNLTKHIV